MIFLTGRSWPTRLAWQWCICTCLVGAILFVSGCAKVSVPNVEGLTQDAASTAITGAELKVGTVSPQSSNNVVAGKVISQDPASGSSLTAGSLVNLVVSSGPEMVPVPNLDGLTQDAATTAVTEAKLKVGTITQKASNTVVTGNVIGQDPAKESSLAQGSAVNLVISSGPQIVNVPNVQGLSENAATTALNEAKFVIGKVGQQTSDLV